MFGDPTGGAPAGGDDGFTWDLQEEPQEAGIPDLGGKGQGAPAAPAPAQAPATPAQPAGSPAAQRDESGRFTAQPSATPEGQGGQPPAEGTAPASPATADESAPDVLDDFPAWTIRADGEAFEVPGSKIGSNGVWFPAEALPQLQQLIAEGVANRGTARELRERLQRENTTLRGQLQNAPDIVKARAFNASIMRLLAQGPEAMQAFFEDFNNNRARLVAEAEQAILLQRNEAQTAELNELREEREAARLEPVMSNSLVSVVEDLAGRPEFAGVDANAIYQRLRTPRGLDAVFYEVQPGERPSGPAEDEFLLGQAADGTLYLMNWGVVAQEFQYQAQFRPAPAATPAGATAANAAALAAGRRSPQAATRTGAPPASPAGEETPPKFASKKEMDAWFEKRFSPMNPRFSQR